MNTKLQARLDVLQSEFEKGKTRLNELQSEQNELQETMLRIQGAITVLQELLADPADDPQDTVVDLDQHRQA
ncbi:hypothetical protein [Herbaspirillum rhizosphaerae]|uniref:hypothetical protein n=1 Tax=Herbaspirillum rhizosphaerae TaxID=346179 RepID=UPI00067DC135|nr:hypothetical protein [Herbaspirillum rhizosphaerae]